MMQQEGIEMATETVKYVRCYLCEELIPRDQADELLCPGCGCYFHDKCMLGKRDIPLGKHSMFIHEELEGEEDE
jgi:predicted RNA-binding Zn-ribbon protein involved in translation (DUF1610 family)